MFRGCSAVVRLGGTHYLGQAKLPINPVLQLFFSQWWTTEKYRRIISDHPTRFALTAADNNRRAEGVASKRQWVGRSFSAWHYPPWVTMLWLDHGGKQVYNYALSNTEHWRGSVCGHGMWDVLRLLLQFQSGASAPPLLYPWCLDQAFTMCPHVVFTLPATGRAHPVLRAPPLSATAGSSQASSKARLIIENYLPCVQPGCRLQA